MKFLISSKKENFRLYAQNTKYPSKVTCREGEQFKFGVKPAGGSLSFDVEKISDDLTEPTGLIGQFLSEVSYEIDEEHNIVTK